MPDTRWCRVGSAEMPLSVAVQIGDVARHVLGFQAWVWKMVAVAGKTRKEGK